MIQTSSTREKAEKRPSERKKNAISKTRSDKLTNAASVQPQKQIESAAKRS
jgi:hypothetical protein